MKATERREIQLQHRARHLAELRAIGYTGHTLIPLRRIENEAHYAAEQYCNGDLTEKQYDALEMRLSNRVAILFGGKLPHGFFINGDPRGYALKLDDDSYSRDPRDPNYMPLTHTDMGGFGILAPEVF